MKKILIIFIIGCFITCSGIIYAQEGRYQLVSFEGDNNSRATVIRIDTETGKSWALFGTKSRTYRWVEINESGLRAAYPKK